MHDVLCRSHVGQRRFSYGLREQHFGVERGLVEFDRLPAIPGKRYVGTDSQHDRSPPGLSTCNFAWATDTHGSTLMNGQLSAVPCCAVTLLDELDTVKGDILGVRSKISPDGCRGR